MKITDVFYMGNNVTWDAASEIVEKLDKRIRSLEKEIVELKESRQRDQVRMLEYIDFMVNK